MNFNSLVYTPCHAILRIKETNHVKWTFQFLTQGMHSVGHRMDALIYPATSKFPWNLLRWALRTSLGFSWRGAGTSNKYSQNKFHHWEISALWRTKGSISDTHPHPHNDTWSGTKVQYKKKLSVLWQSQPSAVCAHLSLPVLWTMSYQQLIISQSGNIYTTEIDKYWKWKYPVSLQTSSC